jgi:hypothetical protein
MVRGYVALPIVLSEGDHSLRSGVEIAPGHQRGRSPAQILINFSASRLGELPISTDDDSIGDCADTVNFIGTVPPNILVTTSPTFRLPNNPAIVRALLCLRPMRRSVVLRTSKAPPILYAFRAHIYAYCVYSQSQPCRHLLKELVQPRPISHEKPSKKSFGETERAFASFTIFSKATFRSPRSTPPT